MVRVALRYWVLAGLHGAQIQDGHRIVERNSPEPQMLDAEYKDNG